MCRIRAQRRIALQTPTAIAAAAIAVLVIVTGLGGCVRVKSSDSEAGAARARQVDLGSFAREEDPADEAGGGGDGSGDESDADPMVLADGWRLGASSGDVVIGGESETPAWLRPGDPIIVDAMVGQVNGRPIFADDFFEPIEDRIIAEASRSVTERDFTDRAAPIIMNELRLVVINALFLAEAQAGLTPMEEKGIRAWLRTLEEEVIAERGGSEEAARERILEEEARTLEEYLEEERDRFLIQRIRYQRIAPRIVVSWRDVEREYRREEARYNPPPTFTLGRIRLATGGQADKVEEVTQRLADGEPFADVAASLGNAGDPEWSTFEAPDGDLRNYPFGEGIRAQVGDLKEVGDTVGPFELGTRTYWLHVVSIERPPSRSLYDPDLQRELIARIRSMRVTEEEDKYIATLLEKGIYDELNEMVQRLMAIALLRYGPRR
jgi:hypothetical protein